MRDNCCDDVGKLCKDCPYVGLSVRARNCLRCEGINSSERLLELLQTNETKIRSIPNCGRTTFAELIMWAWNHQKRRQEAIKGAINMIKQHGYKVTKDDS